MHRLFVALYPPIDVAQAMLATLPPAALTHRVTPAEHLHLTLFFIGDTSPRELKDVRESVARSAAGIPPFAITPLRLITLPQHGDPRLCAVQSDQPAGMMEIQRRLVQRLVRRPGTAKNNRFLPHFTVCRVREGTTSERLDLPVSIPPYPTTHIALVQSTLRQGGAIHDILESFELIA